MDGLVDVLDVSLSESAGERLAGFRIDAPTPGGDASGGPNYALDVRGWVVGRGTPAVAVEVLHDGTCLWQITIR